MVSKKPRKKACRPGDNTIVYYIVGKWIREIFYNMNSRYPNNKKGLKTIERQGARSGCEAAWE